MSEIYDATVIGGGPAGMFAAFYCGLNQFKVQLVEALPQFGGQLTALYPEKKIWDVAGLPGVKSADLVKKLEEQLQLVPVDKFTGEKVTDVTKEADGSFTITSGDRISHSKAIIIALGNGAFKARPLALPGVDKMVGKQVHYFVRHKEDFAGQRVAVLGGGNSALDNAQMLAPVAKEVTVIHRRNNFRGHKLVVDELQSTANVSLMTPYLPREIKLTDDGAVQLTLRKMHSNDEEKTLTVDAVVVNYGFTANNAALRDWSLDLASERNQLTVDTSMATNIPGAYAIGDGVHYEGRTPLIATGFGEAPIAATAITKLLYPERTVSGHSSSLDLGHK